MEAAGSAETSLSIYRTTCLHIPEGRNLKPFPEYVSNTPTNAHTMIVFNNLKFTLKRVKRSYMFRSYDHPQGAYFVPS